MHVKLDVSFSASGLVLMIFALDTELKPAEARLLPLMLSRSNVGIVRQIEIYTL